MMANSNLCPAHTKDAINNYLTHRYQPGSFLMAVLTNDLRGAVAKADHLNLPALPHIVAYCWQNIPSNAWGSVTAVESYLSSPRPELMKD